MGYRGFPVTRALPGASFHGCADIHGQGERVRVRGFNLGVLGKQVLIVCRGEIKEAMTTEILERLVNHLIAMVNEGEQAFVIRKIASSLITIFRHHATPWKRALWQLAASLAHGGYVSEQEAQTVDFLKLMPALNKAQATALMFFSISLAEETLRLDTEPQDIVGPVVQRAAANIKDGLLLVHYIMQQIAHQPALAQSGSPEVTLVMETMSSWKVRNTSFSACSYYSLPLNLTRLGLESSPVASTLGMVRKDVHWL